MAELEEYQESISNSLVNLEELINHSPLFNNDHEKWKAQITREQADIKKEILLMEEEVKDLSASQARSYVGSVRSFKVKLKKLDTDILKRERG